MKSFWSDKERFLGREVLPGGIRLRHLTTCPICGNHAWRFVGRRMNQPQRWQGIRQPALLLTVVQCRFCGVFTVTPFPEGISTIVYERIAPEEYFANAMAFEDRLRDNFLRLLPQIGFRQNWRVLDVGAGTGFLMHCFRLWGAHVKGIEPSARFRAFACQRWHFTPDDFFPVHAEVADLPEHTFHLIVLREVLEHMEDPLRALQRVTRALLPGGFLYVIVPAAEWLLARLLDCYYRVRGTQLTTHTAPLHPPFHLYEFTRRTLRYLAYTLNLYVVWIRPVRQVQFGGRWRPILTCLNYVLRTGIEWEALLMKPTGIDQPRIPAPAHHTH